MRRGLLAVVGNAVPLVVVGALVAAGLVGCSPGPNGITGITVDAGGNLVAVFSWCDDTALHSAFLSRTDVFSTATSSTSSTGSTGSSTTVVARYYAAQLGGNKASLRLDAPGDDWSVGEPVPALVAGPQYAIFGQAGNSGAATTYVRFRVGDKDRLSPGTVLIQTYDRHAQKWIDALVSQADFDQRGLDMC